MKMLSITLDAFEVLLHNLEMKKLISFLLLVLFRLFSNCVYQNFTKAVNHLGVLNSSKFVISIDLLKCP